ncbi:hypothetical protein HK100_008288 [Physocladia obscura]|uniref:Very-long-chain (3R)-3-hydroxyacyl-CoA dehydratase n=1 Tax=Physocladia obscura TaxID=109957 RepID=A0AAD5XA92_9FUNG|nr:hypothetical protein HK100_008288 [Physocladia obscura]
MSTKTTNIKIKTTGLSLVRQYLVTYNAASLVAWSYIAIRVLTNIGNYTTNYENFGGFLLVVQTFALLEIFHSAFGIVRSPIIPNVLQVGSRLIIVWLVVRNFPEVAAVWPYSTTSFAWSVSEVIRYGYYTLNLLRVDNSFFKALTYCRYTFFLVLYPVGACSEFVLMQASQIITKTRPELSTLNTIFSVLLKAWPVGFYFMFSHLKAQRAKFIESLSKDAKKEKVSKKEE